MMDEWEIEQLRKRGGERDEVERKLADLRNRVREERAMVDTLKTKMDVLVSALLREHPNGHEEG